MGPEKIRNDKVDRKWQKNASRSINRTILECKVNNMQSNRMDGVGINRTILECKVDKGVYTITTPEQY